MATWYPEGYNPNQQRVFYPPGPPPLSAAHSKPWRPRASTVSTQTNSSATPRTTSTPEQPNAQGPPPQSIVKTRGQSGTWVPPPQIDLVDGVDYFKIGDTVRIRRWAAATDSFTDWITGQVVRPVLVENDARTYLVSYEDPRTGRRMEKQFSPRFQEIAALVDGKREPERAARLNAAGGATATAFKQQANEFGRTIFAPIPVERPGSGGKVVVYTPCIVLSPPNEGASGVRLRILSGPAANREITLRLNTSVLQAYTPENAHTLRQKGFLVEGDSLRS
ncbi:hypothetical protein C8F01DRAFT_1224781 [Mycena amicta]|nr:hypothetical protein C8F01DRAFT_1224781 [Mycena amicta]